MKISHKVPLIGTAIIIAAFAGFAGFQYLQIRDNTYQQTQANISETSTALGSEISNWLNGRLDIVQGMAELTTEDPTEANVGRVIGADTFGKLVSYYYFGYESDGRLQTSTELNLPEGYDARTRPWYKTAKTSQGASITDPYTDSVDQRLLVTAVSKVTNNAGFQGVLGADIELQAVSDAVNTVTFNNAGYAFIVDSSGKIITHPDSSLFSKNINELFTANTPRLVGDLQKSTIGAQSVLTGFYPLNRFKSSKNQWLIGVVVDEKTVMKPATDLGKTAIIAAILAILLSSLIFYSFMKSALITPVNELKAQADEISRGQFTEDLAGVNRKDEIGDLAQAIQRLQKSLSMAMTRLRAKR